MSQKAKESFGRFDSVDLARFIQVTAPLDPKTSDPGAAAAISLTIALMRALRDRGVLSAGELDDVFTEAAVELRNNAAASQLIPQVRAILDRTDED